MTEFEKLEFLINYLKNENPKYLNYGIPQNEDEAFNLFRSLCNVRMPLPVTDEFLKIQDEMLQERTYKKGITNVENLNPTKSDKKIYLWQGDITTLKCDAIVNAANNQLLGCFVPLHGCIDNIIHTMAGVQLRNKCYEIMQKQGHIEKTGNAKITSGYNLPSKYVIHTVGPIINGFLTDKNENDLKSCYNSCLNIAEENNCHSITFCCISTGVFGYPQKNAAKTAVETTKKWLSEHNCNIKVIFNVFKDSDFKIYNNILNK